MARAAEFDLAKELARPSFTPGARDAAGLVELIARGEEPAATRAGPALAGLGDVGRQAIEAQLLHAGAAAADGDGDAAAAGSAAADPRGKPPAVGRQTAKIAATRTRAAKTDRDRAAGAQGEPGGATGRSIDEGGRARLIAVLGLLARAGDAEARQQLLARLADPAARLRKAAVIALGKLGGDDARQALVARWDAGDAVPEERRALAEALGKVGGEDALARLRALGPSADGELMRRRDRAILMADRTARRDQASRVVGDTAPPTAIELELDCRPGLGALLCEELAALGIAARPVGDRGAALRLAGPLSALFAARLWSSLAILIALDPGAELGAAITQAITAPATLALLRAWTRGPIRWRLGFEIGHKRSIVWRVARDVTAAAPELINDPTATTWDAIVSDAGEPEPDPHARGADDQRGATPPLMGRGAGLDRRADRRSGPERRADRGSGPERIAGRAQLVLVPRRLDDPRFSYRVAEIPAASHPTVAAALAWLGEPRPGDRIWDPFCGSALELVECARRSTAGSLIGSDVDQSALAAARANLDAAGVVAELVIGDARGYAPGPVPAATSSVARLPSGMSLASAGSPGAAGSIDLIITNPPLGSRIAIDAAALLIAALPNLVRALAPHGRLVWITPSSRRTSPVAEQLGLVRRRSFAVDLGGVRGQLERWERGRT